MCQRESLYPYEWSDEPEQEGSEMIIKHKEKKNLRS